MRSKMVSVTVMMALLMVVSTWFVSSLQPRAFDSLDYSIVDRAETEGAFEVSQSNEDLMKLVEALCWQYETAGEPETREPLLRYGQLLLDRAKAETLDLETIGQPEITLQVLGIIRELGAR